jgi:hypothetical protein
VPTSTYLALHVPVGLAILALGFGALVWRKRRYPAVRPNDPEAEQS